jgi:hypothetical protein
MEVIFAMQGMAAKGRGSLAGDHQYKPVTGKPLAFDKVQKPQSGLFSAQAMQVNP